MSSWQHGGKTIFKVTVIHKPSFKPINIVSCQVFEAWVRANFVFPTVSFSRVLCSGFLTHLDLKRDKREKQGGSISDWFGPNVSSDEHRALLWILCLVLWFEPESLFLFLLWLGDTHSLSVLEGSAVGRLPSWAVSTYGRWDLHTFELSVEGSVFTSYTQPFNLMCPATLTF